LPPQADAIRHNGADVAAPYKSGEVVALAASEGWDELAGTALSKAATV
jgi:hypothetical protein